jgi:stress-induced morphogen
MLKSERTFKSHKANCHLVLYSCSECSKSFKNYRDLAKHRGKDHSKVNCDLCDHVCHSTNMKRHIKNKHKGLRPNTSTVKTVKLEKTFKCEICYKFFFDKSTLNRHKKTHCFECRSCAKTFQTKLHLKEHLEAHKIQAKKEGMKSLSWSSEIEKIKEIP